MYGPCMSSHFHYCMWFVAWVWRPPGRAHFLCIQRSGDPQQTAQNPPHLLSGMGALPYQDSVTRDNCQSNRLLVGRQPGRFSPQLSLNHFFMCASQGEKCILCYAPVELGLFTKAFIKWNLAELCQGMGHLELLSFFVLWKHQHKTKQPLFKPLLKI